MSLRNAIEERGSWASAAVTKVEYSPEATLEQLLLEVTVEYPDATALLGEEGSLSYSDLLIRAQNVATLLRRKGVEPGDLVGIAGRRTFATISAIVGTLLAGAVYVMFDIAGRGDDALARQLVVSRVRLLLLDGSGDMPDIRWAGQTPVVDLQKIEREIMPLFAQVQLPKVTADGPATVLFGNDTDGVLVTHRGLVRLLSSSELLDFNSEERLLLHGDPCSHTWQLEIWGSLLAGSALALAPADTMELQDFDPVLRRFCITSLCLQTPEFHRLAEQAPAALSDLRQILIGGEWPAHEDVRHVLERAPGIRMVYGVGWAETTSYVLAFPEASVENGRALPGVRVSILGAESDIPTVSALDDSPASTSGDMALPTQVGDDLDPKPREERVDEEGAGAGSREEIRNGPTGSVVAGQLAIGGEMLAIGYLGQPQLTRKRFDSDGEGRCFLTGERGFRNADGSFHFLSSNAEAHLQPESMAIGMEIKDIESLLREHPLVEECAVVPMQDGTSGTCAFVSLQSPDADAEQAIRAHILKHVPEHCRPAFLLILPSLPFDARGRLDRQRLLEQGTPYTGKAPQPEEAPRMVDQVRSVWQRLLHRMHVGLDDDFFAAGGTSVQMIRLHAELNRRFPGAITMADLSALRTIRKVLEHLGSAAIRERMVALHKRGA